MAFSLMEIYPLAQNNHGTENRDQIWIENFRNLHMKKKQFGHWHRKWIGSGEHGLQPTPPFGTLNVARVVIRGWGKGKIGGKAEKTTGTWLLSTQVHGRGLVRRIRDLISPDRLKN